MEGVQTLQLGVFEAEVGGLGVLGGWVLHSLGYYLLEHLFGV